MQFHIRMRDDPIGTKKRRETVEDHWAYLDTWADYIIGRGPTFETDGSGPKSSIFFVEFDGWDDVRKFVDEEPSMRAGVYQPAEIVRWKSGLARRQRDFPRAEDQVCWYVRGFGGPGAAEKRASLVQSHLDYFGRYDDQHVVIRGPVMDESGTTWMGSAMILAFPTLANIEAVLKDEPYTQNGLYERIEIERFKFGGRPGQIT